MGEPETNFPVGMHHHPGDNLLPQPPASLGRECSSFGPRGGPVYLANMVGPLTRVPEFHSSLLHLLQDLEAQLCLDFSSEDDISVDGLKVYTEEELTDMGMKETFRDQDANDKNVELGSDGRFDDVPASSEVNPRKKKKVRREKKMGKRRKAPNHHFEEGFVTKLSQLAKIKQRQDEDKLSVKLHCLNPDRTIEGEGVKSTQSFRSTNYAAKPVTSSDVHERVVVPSTEVVLCVEIYHNIRKSVKTQELLVLGHQKLTDLRDKIHCLTDQVMEKAGQNDPSGYFLIEDIFCNDLRDRSAIDYSKPILDWLKNSKDEALGKWESILTGELQQKQKAVLGEAKPMDLPHFGAMDMHTTRFCDLRLQLGAGYLYCHQGDCKHMIVIRDMRLIHPEDDHNPAAYPRVIFQHKTRVQKCSVCKIYRASMVTVNDKWAKENPCYFCDYCYSLLHSEDIPLSSDCPVYDYLHD